ncbi:MAG: adenylate/guanylate cyclase domain-containing protein [Rhodospirillales bacterium]|nr:adenylate/guanylate cyclase domain-containing protein [Rhodospirillales bacterium]
MAADVAGYSRLIGLDEEGTVSALKAHRTALFEPRIAHHRGRLVKTTGDGLLVEFPSVVDAVRCAVDVQREMARRNGEIAPDRRIEFRIGIHVGDIVAEQDDIFGDGVNIAARLEALAEPGGISVSARVQEDAEGRLDVAFVDDGQHQLKNIARPVRVYRVQLAPVAPGAAPRPAAAVAGAVVAAPPMPASELPSIAVMPFQNLTSEADQDYFADGVVDDVINGLSRYRTLLFVIARNSTFTYKGRAVDVKQVGRELNVRYVLEGSVRRAGNRLRIGGQLIDATTAVQIWSDRFEGEIEDIFALQDRVAESVVGALVPQVREAEMNRARRTPTESVDSHLAYMQALGFFHTWSRDGLEKALQLCYRAIELDPNYATPYGLALNCFCLRRTAGWAADRAHDNAEARRLCDRVLEIGRDNFLAVASSGFAMASLFGECEQGAALIDESLKLNPNASATLVQSGFVRTWLGEPELAIHQLQRAMRNSPVDVLMFSMHTGMALAHFVARRDDEAYAWAEKALQRNPLASPAVRIAVASAALLGRLPDATKYLSLLRQLDPGLLLSNLADRVNLSRPQDRERLVEGLRKAGLPE